MSPRLYELRWDPTDEGQWYLDPPVDASGHPLDHDLFLEGKRLEVAEVFLAIGESGHPLDVTFGAFGVAVTERIGSLIEELAPGDVQRIPARVESMDERYEILNVLARIDCIDRDRTAAHVRVEGDPPYMKKGSLASLAPLLAQGPDLNLYGHVQGHDMRLKTADLEGSRIFRVEGWDHYPVVTEDIKVALEAEGATGVDYRLIS